MLRQYILEGVMWRFLKCNKLGEKEIKKRGKVNRVWIWPDDKLKDQNMHIFRNKVFKIRYIPSRICNLLRN